MIMNYLTLAFEDPNIHGVTVARDLNILRSDWIEGWQIRLGVFYFQPVAEVWVES